MSSSLANFPKYETYSIKGKLNIIEMNPQES